MHTIADIRKEYKLQTLDEADVHADAIQQFHKWWNEALMSEIEEVNAMTLATATVSGKPSARVVLLKGYDESGFVFFTNYHSHKGMELAENPVASLVFFWKELERQVRIDGTVEKTTSNESDLYFHSRPVESRIGAWASPQSKVIASREVIEENLAELQKSFAGKGIDRPPHWGGYIVKPTLIEFWQGRPGRLHDRIQYTIQANGSWKVERLAP
jgi:pyridoxamine 5'-phosphate oxidase